MRTFLLKGESYVSFIICILYPLDFHLVWPSSLVCISFDLFFASHYLFHVSHTSLHFHLFISLFFHAWVLHNFCLPTEHFHITWLYCSVFIIIQSNLMITFFHAVYWFFSWIRFFHFCSSVVFSYLWLVYLYTWKITLYFNLFYQWSCVPWKYISENHRPSSCRHLHFSSSLVTIC